MDKPQILTVKLEKNKSQYWSNITICLDKIPKDNINVLGVSFYYKFTFVTKSNRTFFSEGTFVGQKNSECVDINCSSLHKRGMTDEEFTFYKDQILFDSISSMKVELFKQKSNYGLTPITSSKVTKFVAK